MTLYLRINVSTFPYPESCIHGKVRFKLKAWPATGAQECQGCSLMSNKQLVVTCTEWIPITGTRMPKTWPELRTSQLTTSQATIIKLFWVIIKNSKQTQVHWLNKEDKSKGHHVHHSPDCWAQAAYVSKAASSQRWCKSLQRFVKILQRKFKQCFQANPW